MHSGTRTPVGESDSNELVDLFEWERAKCKSTTSVHAQWCCLQMLTQHTPAAPYGAPFSRPRTQSLTFTLALTQECEGERLGVWCSTVLNHLSLPSPPPSHTHHIHDHDEDQLQSCTRDQDYQVDAGSGQ